jgi:hypothetical protein
VHDGQRREQDQRGQPWTPKRRAHRRILLHPPSRDDGIRRRQSEERPLTTSRECVISPLPKRTWIADRHGIAGLQKLK